MRKFLFVVVGLVLMQQTLVAQRMTREQYINKYSKIAVQEMNRVGIPASITLA